MTREEEIRQAAEEYSGLPKYQDPFILGAQWADEHPKDPWISVNERLPEEFQIVFVRMQGGSCDSAMYTNGVFRRDLQLNFGMKDDGYTIISWQQMFKSNITHWMPIPELPKGGEK